MDPMNRESSNTLLSWKARLVPRIFREVISEFRLGGFRAVVKRFGWKILLGFFLYYLVRDSILYLLIPYLIARGLLFY